MSLELTAPPVLEPVTLAQAKAHARVEITADDGLLTGMIATARESVERCIGRALLAQTWILWLDAWTYNHEEEWWDGMREGPEWVTSPIVPVRLPYGPPVNSILQVTVYGANGAETIVDPASYLLDASGSRLCPVTGLPWPNPGRAQNGIAIQYAVGVADPDDVAPGIKQAVLETVAHLYQHRGDSANISDIPPGVRARLVQYKGFTL